MDICKGELCFAVASGYHGFQSGELIEFVSFRDSDETYLFKNCVGLIQFLDGDEFQRID